METFSNTSLCQEIKKVLEKNKFCYLTDIQKKTLPHMLNNKDVVVISQTGSGKTLCFVLPVLQNYFKKQTFFKNMPACLIASPTRELAVQIAQVFDMFELRTRCLIGGIPIEEDLKVIEKGCDIVIGTPGRLLEIVKMKAKLFERISNLVLDEADRLLSLGFREKVLKIVSLLPKTKATSFFSATMNDGIKKLSKSFLKNPIFIDNEADQMPENLSIKYVIVRSCDKLQLILELSDSKKIIVFFATCNQVDFFYCFLVKYGKQNVFKIHRKMNQNARNEVYSNFFNNGQILLCTDIAARGIDFKNIDIVVSFDIPNGFDNFVHRSGRTARNGLFGESILFVMPNELSYIDFLKIKKIEASKINFSIKSESHLLKKYMDENILVYAVRAFVAYFRSYKEHILSYILDYTTVDLDDLIDLFMLKKVPRMKELKNVKFKKFPREVEDGN